MSGPSLYESIKFVTYFHDVPQKIYSIFLVDLCVNYKILEQSYWCAEIRNYAKWELLTSGKCRVQKVSLQIITSSPREVITKIQNKYNYACIVDCHEIFRIFDQPLKSATMDLSWELVGIIISVQDLYYTANKWQRSIIQIRLAHLPCVHLC